LAEVNYAKKNRKKGLFDKFFNVDNGSQKKPKTLDRPKNEYNKNRRNRNKKLKKKIKRRCPAVERFFKLKINVQGVKKIIIIFFN
jgi:hypothetical protein